MAEPDLKETVASPSTRDLTNPIGCVDVQRLRKIQHDRQRRDVLAALDKPDVAHAQLRALRECFLRKPTLVASLADQ